MTTGRLRNVEDVYPLTPMQQGMLYHSLTETSQATFFNQHVIDLSGDLDVDRFREVWRELVNRHPVLRTAFLWDGLDEPLQVVREQADLEWAEDDWSGLDGTAADERLKALLEHDRERGFDLRFAPLMRMRLIRMGPASWRWLWTFHHVIADGWSAQILRDQAIDLYGAPDPGSAAAGLAVFPFRDFVAEHLNRDDSAAQSFWADALAGFEAPHRLEVPGSPPRGSGYESLDIEMDKETTKALERAAASRGVTLGTTLLGAWAVVLSRWMRTPDVVFGMTVSGRSAGLPGIEDGVGLFINTLPFRADVRPGQSLGDWLRDLQTRRLAIQEHEQTPLASIQRWSQIARGDALFESLVVFENFPSNDPSSARGEVHVEGVEALEHSNYPLAVLVEPEDRLRLHLVYDSSRLSDEAVRSLGAQLRTVLTQFAEPTDRKLSAYRLLTEAAATDTARAGEGPAPAPADGTIHAVIARTAARVPAHTAVVSEQEALTYEDLQRRSAAVAGALVASGVERGTLVGLYLPRSVDMVVGMLAILRAGGAYVPLDPAYPREHIARLLDGEPIDFVLTDRAHDLPSTVTVVTIDVDDSQEGAFEAPAADPDDLAYVIHTSGSTGRPKGVMVTHRNLVSSTAARDVHYRDPVGRFLLLSSFAFDSSVAGIFWTLATGGTLVLPAPGAERDIDALLDLAGRHEVTHTLALPTLYQVLVESARDGQLSDLRVAIVAGEACLPDVVATHLRHLPSTELHNEYGPTEATVWATVHRATEEDRGAPLPIGKPIAGAMAYLLDERGRPVPPGFPGELCIGGTGISPGYLGRDDLTAERFVSLDVAGRRQRIYRTGDLAAQRADGALLFLGRADRQLKIRGHRIEATAVESALRDLPTIHDAVVTGRALPGSRGAQLVAHVVTRGDVDKTAVTASLRAALPAFMVPDVIVEVPGLPRLPNGKVDVGALADPTTDPDSYVAPRTEGETVLAAIWQDLLGLDTVGVRDDFFALGGDSIVSLQMISRARKAGLQIQPGMIVTHPTVEGLAAASLATPAATGRERVTGPVPLGPIQRWFFDLDLEDPHHWNLAALFEVPADTDVAALAEALQACVERHDMLRARFHPSESGWSQEVQAAMQLDLEVVDDPGIDIEAAVAMRQASLDIERGPLVRATLFGRDSGSAALLLVVVHHLVMDIVSWTILIEDLESAYAQAAAKRPVSLPPRTTSFRDWVGFLESSDRSSELEHWSSTPPPVSAGTGVEASGQAVSVTLDADSTRQVLTAANDAYRTRTEDLLVAALVDPIANWTGAREVSIAMESHGRSDTVDGIDLSGTVGWFTALYPVTFETARDDGSLLRSVKERLRDVPDRGIGYGVLAHLDRDARLADRPTPGISFNYLSRSAGNRPGRLLSWVSSLGETTRGPRNARPHGIEIVAEVRGDALTIEWHFSQDEHDEATIARLAESHLDGLKRLVAHCLSPAAGGFTPSDFPDAGLDQASLDEFLEEL